MVEKPAKRIFKKNFDNTKKQLYFCAAFRA
jgi:hypothetical protein